MNVGPLCRHQGDLTEQKHKPGREQGPVQMNERWERRPS
jgi:hypothetical protein